MKYALNLFMATLIFVLSFSLARMYSMSGTPVAKITRPQETTFGKKWPVAMPKVDEVDNFEAPEVSVNIDGVSKEAKADPKCVRDVLARLEKASPHAKYVYDRVKDKKQFEVWLSDCSDKVITVSTAAHEATHHITAQFQDKGFLLLDRTIATIDIGDNSGLPPPNLLTKKFKYDRKQGWVETYLLPGEGSASSNEYFAFLLNEFNAYTNDIHIQMEIKKDAVWGKTGEPSRVGFVSLMVFTADYVAMVKEDHPQHWKTLLRNRVAIEKMWTQAEQAFSKTAGFETSDDEIFAIRAMCDKKRMAAISDLIDRPANACVKSPLGLFLIP